MNQPKIFTAIGLMSGTSMDGVDASILKTDGLEYIEIGQSITVPYDDAMRVQIVAAIQGKAEKEMVARAITLKHVEAVKQLLAQTGMQASEIDLIGFHGQTIDHRPHEGVTVQIGDGDLLAKETGIDVVFDFRTADVKAGGEGAPLVPVYHRALIAEIAKPLAIVNIGGVSNISWVGEKGEMIAFDTGPGNALIDDVVHQETGKSCDEDGQIAAKGAVDEACLSQMMAHPYFERKPPKSLDRNEFAACVETVSALSFEDKVATLTAFTAKSILKACDHFPLAPHAWYITGGGRHNATLMEMLAKDCVEYVKPIEVLGHNGDSLEAEAFAYLAVRSKLGLPLTYSSTTGIKAPELTGGRFCAA